MVQSNHYRHHLTAEIGTQLSSAFTVHLYRLLLLIYRLINQLRTTLV